MKNRRERWGIVLGLALCVLSLAFSVALQRAGYLTYLNSDMSSEVILAHRQAETRSLVQMDWLYSTEIHTLHMNLLYALAFLVTPSFKIARIIGNTAGFVIGMAALFMLLRRLRVSRGASLLTAALLPFAASTLYASNMTIGGYYIVHLPFAYGVMALWLAPRKGRRGRIALAALSFLMGLLSVRYVLCFICPMLALAALELAGERETPERLLPLALRTALAFAACAAGYVLSEIVYPRLFVSGTGAASSFHFNPLDGEAMLRTLVTVFADFLKLLGWRGSVPLFSAAGIVNLLIAALLVLGGMIALRAWRGMERGTAECHLLGYAALAFIVNLFCFIFLEGAYLNRYLIVAVLPLVPCLPVALKKERNGWLRRGFAALLALELMLSGLALYRDTRAQEMKSVARTQDALDAGEWLLSEGYERGYGTYWNIRTLEERLNGQLQMAGVRPEETEEGAVCPVSLASIRWLEPAERSDLDYAAGKAFLLLTREEEAQLADWLAFAEAPLLYANDGFAVYGFSSGTAFWNAALLGSAKLTDAALQDGVWRFEPGGRLRVPTGWREAGDYSATVRVSEGNAGKLRLYRGASFQIVAEQALEPGESALTFTLDADDKYFMLLVENGDEPLTLETIRLDKR